MGIATVFSSDACHPPLLLGAMLESSTFFCSPPGPCAFWGGPESLWGASYLRHAPSLHSAYLIFVPLHPLSSPSIPGLKRELEKFLRGLRGLRGQGRWLKRLSSMLVPWVLSSVQACRKLGASPVVTSRCSHPLCQLSSAPRLTEMLPILLPCPHSGRRAKCLDQVQVV